MTVMFWPVVIFMAISLAIGLYTYTKVRGSSTRFTVCEKSLPFIVVGTTLMAQAVDGNSTLGAVSITYTGERLGGPDDLASASALSLFVVGRVPGAPLNRMNLLTLPEFFYRRYGKRTELLVSMLTIVSFTVLIAGNLSAVAWVLSVVSGSGYLPALVVATGGHRHLHDRGRPLLGRLDRLPPGATSRLVGFAAAAVVADRDARLRRAWSRPCRRRRWICPRSLSLRKRRAGELGGHDRAGASGNAMALDFMERVFAARDGRTARRGCYYSAAMTIFIGVCVAVIGLAGVASVQGRGRSADGAADRWPSDYPAVLDRRAGVHRRARRVDVHGQRRHSRHLGRARAQRRAALAATTMSRIRQMLRLSRLMALPTAAAAALVAWVRPEPGILLIIAFDIVFAGCVVPLFAGVYWPKANSAGAIAVDRRRHDASRLIAHFVTPAAWAGLDTLVPPVLSAVTFYRGLPAHVEDARRAVTTC